MEGVIKLKLFSIDLAIRRNDIAITWSAKTSKQHGYTGLALLRARELLAVAQIEIAEVIERSAYLRRPLLGTEQ